MLSGERSGRHAASLATPVSTRDFGVGVITK